MTANLKTKALVGTVQEVLVDLGQWVADQQAMPDDGWIAVRDRGLAALTALAQRIETLEQREKRLSDHGYEWEQKCREAKARIETLERELREEQAVTDDSQVQRELKEEALARVDALERVNEDLAKERSAAVDAANHWHHRSETLEREYSESVKAMEAKMETLTRERDEAQLAARRGAAEYKRRIEAAEAKLAETEISRDAALIRYEAASKTAEKMMAERDAAREFASEKQTSLVSQWRQQAEAAEAKLAEAEAALASIESMTGAGGSGEIPAMPIAEFARAALRSLRGETP